MVDVQVNVATSALAGNKFMNENIIGMRIAQGRKSKGLSQAQFAESLCVTPQAVGKWERGESLPDVFTLGKVGEVIGNTDLNYFLGKDPCGCDCGCCACCVKP